MRTNFRLYNITNPLCFCCLLVIGLMLTISSVEAGNTEAPLEIKTIDGKLALGQTIKVEVSNLDTWVNPPSHDPSKFILSIDGNLFNGLTPTLVDNNTKLQFDLKRTPESRDAWNAVLSRRPKKFTRDVPVTVHQDGVNVKSKNTSLIVIDPFHFNVFIVSFVLAIAFFWILAYQTDIIREPGPQPEGTNTQGLPNRKPYSLARTQMAFWFFAVIISYVFIWMITSDLSSLTPSVLGLIGISTATGLSSAIVSSSKRNNRENQRRSLEKKLKNDEVEAEKIRSGISTLNAAINATPAPANLEEQRVALAAKQAELAAKQKEIDQLNQQIQKLPAATKPAVSKHFIDDILSDDDGVSFHRFQMFAWTIVLLTIFVVSVCNVLTMPDFDTTLLALMGISGGTYIGFKLPEQEG